MNTVALPALVWPVASGICFALLGFVYRYAAGAGCRPPAFTAAFLFVGTVFSIAVSAGQPTVWHDARLWLLGCGMGIAIFCAVALVAFLNRVGPASVVWTVINLSVLLTILLARLVLAERLVVADGLVLLLFAAMVASLSQGIRSAQETPRGGMACFWLLLSAAFVLNGLFAFGMKVKEVWLGPDSSAGLAAIFYGAGTLLAVVFFAVAHGTVRFTAAEWRTGTLAGLCSGLGNILFLAGMELPAVVAFPVAQGISLVGGALLTSLLFHERLSRAKVAGWALGVAVLVLSLVREELSRWLAGLSH